MQHAYHASQWFIEMSLDVIGLRNYLLARTLTELEGLVTQQKKLAPSRSV